MSNVSGFRHVGISAGIPRPWVRVPAHRAQPATCIGIVPHTSASADRDRPRRDGAGACTVERLEPSAGAPRTRLREGTLP
jgi:hypothetical protein